MCPKEYPHARHHSLIIFIHTRTHTHHLRTHGAHLHPAYLRAARAEEALKDAQEAVSLDPQYVKALFRRAQVLWILERVVGGGRDERKGSQ